jgi:ankyrin repeat protein
LIIAARYGYNDTIESLVAMGADVNQTDKRGWAALTYAANNNNAEAVKILLKHGADKSLKAPYVSFVAMYR